MIVFNTYGFYYIPDEVTHRPAGQTLIAGGVYEADTVTFIRTHHTGRDIIHAGAFFGDMLPALAGSGAGQVWAFEPHPLSFAAAQKTCLLNAFKNVRLFPCALGDTTRPAYLVTQDSDGHALGGGSYVQTEVTPTPVQVRRLDDLIPAYHPIGLIHLDVEGYEVAALQGAQRILSQYKPVLVLECWPEKNAAMTALLRAQGYSLTDTLNNNQVWQVL